MLGQKKMLGRVLVIIGCIWLGRKSIYSARQFVRKKRAPNYQRIGGEDRISALSDDLLVHILSLIPTKDAMATMILSKRWRSIWTMIPRIKYKDTQDGMHKQLFGGLLGCFGLSKRPRSIWRLLNESLQLHKAPILEKLTIKLGPHCPVDADVGKWIRIAVDRRIRELNVDLMWSGEPTSLPKKLYICGTLVSLRLSNKVFVDVPSSACLPSLKYLYLVLVIYKDEDSLVRLLSSCLILKYLHVMRQDQDNVTRFPIKVPSLETLVYIYLKPRVVNEEDVQDIGVVNEEDVQDIGGSLIIDSAILEEFSILDNSNDSCTIENKPYLDEAVIYVHSHPDDKFLRSLSSVSYLELALNLATVPCCGAIIFSRLKVCQIRLFVLDWFEPFLSLLLYSPNLEVLVIDQTELQNKAFQFSWTQPSNVPACLSAKLEIFEWKGYRGTTEEKEILRYIFANSKRLKRAGISLKSSCSRRHRKKIMEELKSMYRISTSSQLFFTTRLKFTTKKGSV